MPLLNIKQGTDEWHEARKGILTASNCATAAGLGESYGSRIMLWKDLNGLVEKKVTAPMMYGTEHEEDARHDWEVAMGLLSYPVGIFLHPKINWLGASPDGVIHKKGLHEIKCREKNPYADVPPHHMAQVQMQLACAEDVQCYYQSWTPDEQRIWLIKKSQPYIDWILPLLSEFWGYILRKEQPPILKRKRWYTEPLPYELIHDSQHEI
jgi:putative phage-type endonuclease